MLTGKFRIKLKNTLNDSFNSKAKVIYLTSFRKGRLIWQIGEKNQSDEFYFSVLHNTDYFPKMPVILQSSGIPWAIGNAYLLGQLSNPNVSNMKTLSARAIHLKYYLQYLEDTEQHFLDLPKIYHERAPQRFKVFMIKILDNHDYSSEYINNILSTVAHFYTNIRYESLVPENSLQNEPFTQIKKTIMTTNQVGLAKSIDVITNDLRIKSSRSQTPELGKIRDGGSVRPLTLEEQRAVFEGFKKNYASIELELMMRVAIETGARQQSVCTLSISCIRKAYDALEADSSIAVTIVNVGNRFKADSKGGRLNRLMFGRELINDLIDYIDCERAENRRKKQNSFYNDTDDNYVFLTRNGNPYLTAQREIIDRQIPKPMWNDKAPTIILKNGQSLRNELKRFLLKIKKNNSAFCDFSFHDLRATAGMNVVRSMRAASYPDSKIFDHVRQFLNHRNIKTTETYLDFDSELTEFNDIQEAFGSMFYGDK